MKKLLSFVTGIAAVLTFGSALAGETFDKMIRNDDLLQYKLDQDRSTVNQLPALPDAGISGAEGSAAGGVRNDTDPWLDENKSETPAAEPAVEPAEKSPAREDTGTGGTHFAPDKYDY